MEKIKHKRALALIGIYFSITGILVISEIFHFRQALVIFKPMLMPSLAVAYILISGKINRIYLVCLAFALASNLSFLSSAPDFLLLGISTFMIQRALSIIIVLRLVDRPLLIPSLVAALPFLFIFASLINLTIPTSAPSFYPTVVNALLIAVMAGISLSAYILNDSRANSWLAISTLFFVVLVFLFLIEKYYLANVAFQPMSALLFALAHYGFYMFVIESEKSVEIKQ